MTQIRTDYAASLAASKARLVVESPLGTCWGDHGRIEQLLGNLISNALKFRRPDVEPEILVTSRDEGNSRLLVVADNGIGIDPRYHAPTSRCSVDFTPARSLRVPAPVWRSVGRSWRHTTEKSGSRASWVREPGSS